MSFCYSPTIRAVQQQNGPERVDVPLIITIVKHGSRPFVRIAIEEILCGAAGKFETSNDPSSA